MPVEMETLRNNSRLMLRVPSEIRNGRVIHKNTTVIPAFAMDGANLEDVMEVANAAKGLVYMPDADTIPAGTEIPVEIVISSVVRLVEGDDGP